VPAFVAARCATASICPGDASSAHRRTLTVARSFVTAASSTSFVDRPTMATMVAVGSGSHVQERLVARVT
jgi:hypothetical protein